MSDELDVNPAAPDAAPAPITPVVEVAPAAPVATGFETTPLHSEMMAHIEQFGGYATARLHQLLAEMRDLLNL